VDATQGMQIGDLARKTGKTVRALHLYEELGILSAGRSEAGYRLYDSDALARVYWISKLQTLGFRLPQIRGLLEAVAQSASAPSAMDGVRELFRSKLAETRTQMRELEKLETDLAASLAYLEDCRACGEHSTSACAVCEPERHSLPQPKLVAGIHLSRNLRSP
jgi:DNA-binding transcriptional MerR regulator